LADETLLAQLRRALDSLRREQPGLPELDEPRMLQLAVYLDLVVQYNRAAQLTGLRNPAQLASELAAESLRLLALGGIPPGTQLLDLGSGNGSPVVPLAIACPEIDCHASEVRERRIAFLQTCVVRLRLGNLHVLAGPVERLAPAGGGRWDMLTSRAFAPPDRLLPLAEKLLAGPGEVRGFLGSDSTGLAELARQHGFRLAALETYRHGEKPRHLYQLIRG
jgi:16S rRNA (guanine(527)-N(7))-methyltransferase RsmG